SYRHFPSDSRILMNIKPVYQELRGWNEPVDQVQSWNELPSAAQDYLEFIQEFTEIPISLISVGPARRQTITR
ncbi:adenylosuccinate synthetase, partial [bacterium]|nr:adenylosuccinate synthetase [bacterium]